MNLSDVSERELVERLRLGVMRLARRLRQQAEAGVTPSMLSALATLERGSVTLGELADAERVTPPTITRIVARLEESGFAAKEADEKDGRVTRIHLTTEGKRLIQRNRRRKNEYLARRLEALDAAEPRAVEAAVALLERLLEDE